MMRRRCSQSPLFGHGREAPRGVPREPGGDGGVGPVAQQAQRDVHADLRPAAREQRPPADEVGARLPAGVGHLGAPRAQLVVERIDDRYRSLQM